MKTPEADLLLSEIRRLAAAGLSAAQIGAQIGLTKNQVVGRGWRNGIRFHGVNTGQQPTPIEVLRARPCSYRAAQR